MPVKRKRDESASPTSPPLKRSNKSSPVKASSAKANSAKATSVKAGSVKATSVKASPTGNQTEVTPTALKIVITGVTDIIPRDALEQKLKDKGLSVTSAVSGVTHILVCGKKLEDGRDYVEGSKYKKAQELIANGKTKNGLRILMEDEFLEEFPDLKPQALTSEVIEEAVKTSSLETTSNHFMWSEKWRPRAPADFAFNVEAYKSLHSWLSRWDPTQDAERAALLCGPPGIGKTSACLALAQDMHYKLTEFNASDTRGQKQLKNLQALISGGASLSKGLVADRILILMDEADGLSSGDRGGSQELIRMIKVTRVPIVCTCNDRQHPKIRTLSKSCRVIAFQKPDRPSAVRRATLIAAKEGFKVTESFVASLYDSCDGDMRQLLNGLQMSLLNSSSSLSSPSLNQFILKDLNTADDVMTGVRKLFARENLTKSERLNVFFSDYDMVPLVVQENYARLLQNYKKNDRLQKMCQVADSISFGDFLNQRVRGLGQWDLLPDVGFFTTVLPTSYVTGAPFRMEFPRLLGRISSQNKHKRQIAEIGGKTGRSGRRFVIDGYFNLLGEELVKPLSQDSIGVADRIEMFFEGLSAYHLTKDLVVENLMDIRLARDIKPYDKVETKVKTALTRAANSLVQPGQLISSHKSKGSKGAKKAKKKISEESAGETDTEEVEDDQTKEKEEEEGRMGAIF